MWCLVQSGPPQRDSAIRFEDRETPINGLGYAFFFFLGLSTTGALTKMRVKPRPFTARKDSAAGGARKSEKCLKKALHSRKSRVIHTHGTGENQAGAIRAGLARRACGEDVRRGEILAASVKQEPTVSAVLTA